METLIGVFTLAPIALIGVIGGGVWAVSSKGEGFAGGITMVLSIVGQALWYYYVGFPDAAQKTEALSLLM